MATNIRQTAETPADRLRHVFERWKESERRAGRPANLVSFASTLGFDSHSAIADQLNKRRGNEKRAKGPYDLKGDVTTKVVRACYDQWGISANWLLFGEGPMHVYECVQQGETTAQVAELLAIRLNHAKAPELERHGTRAIARREDAPGLLVDANQALERAFQAVEADLDQQLLTLDLYEVKHEATRQAQHAAVHGTKLPPLLKSESFRRIIERTEPAEGESPSTLHLVLRQA